MSQVPYIAETHWEAIAWATAILRCHVKRWLNMLGGGLFPRQAHTLSCPVALLIRAVSEVTSSRYP